MEISYMQAGPMVSICIPVCDGESFISETLASAIGQSYSNTEIIVVDDCSIDGSPEIIHQYLKKHSRIRYFRNDKRLGLVANWNRCIELCQGDWVKFLFQDDVLDPSCIEKMMSSLDDSSDGASVVFCKRDYIFEDDEYSNNLKIPLENAKYIWDMFPKRTSFSLRCSLQSMINFFPHNFFGEPSSFLLHRSIWDDLGFYDRQFIQFCDLEFNFRLLTAYDFVLYPEPLVSFRVHGSSTSSRNARENSFQLNHLEKIKLLYKLHVAEEFDRLREVITIGFPNTLFFCAAALEMRTARKAAEENQDLDWLGQYQKFSTNFADLEKESRKPLALLTLKHIYGKAIMALSLALKQGQ